MGSIFLYRILSAVMPGRCRMMMPPGRRRRTVMHHPRRGRTMYHRRRCHHNSRLSYRSLGPLQSSSHKSDDVGGKSYAVIAMMMMSAVVRTSHDRHCAQTDDTDSQSDLENFHFCLLSNFPGKIFMILPMFRPYNGVYFNFIVLIIKKSLLFF